MRLMLTAASERQVRGQSDGGVLSLLSWLLCLQLSYQRRLLVSIWEVRGHRG